MIAFLLRRCGQAALVIVAVGLIAFSMLRFVGDPVFAIVGQDASPAERAELHHGLGLDDPIASQFGLRRTDLGARCVRPGSPHE